MTLANAVVAAGKRIARSAAGKMLSPIPDSYLFMPINGAGLGHVSRCLAVANALRRLNASSDITFFTSSIAVPLVQRAGYRCYHVPPAWLNDMPSELWNRMLRDVLMAVAEVHRPGTVMFDGTWPYHGLRAVMRCCPQIRFVWMRRGLHKRRISAAEWRLQREYFSLTVVPGELGSPSENEPRGIARIDPVVILGREDLLARDIVRSRLGLHQSKPVVYVQLGAGNINDTEQLETSVVAALRRIPELQIVLARSPIMLRDDALPVGVDVVLMDYPNARYFRGFDAAVLAAGYNSVYEAVGLRLPAVLLPNESTGSDDQALRAEAVSSLRGWACLRHWSNDGLCRSVQELLSLERNVEDIAQTWRGAEQAASLLVQHS